MSDNGDKDNIMTTRDPLESTLCMKHNDFHQMKCIQRECNECGCTKAKGESSTVYE